jgi:hypothetical protein
VAAGIASSSRHHRAGQIGVPRDLHRFVTRDRLAEQSAGSIAITGAAAPEQSRGLPTQGNADA